MVLAQLDSSFILLFAITVKGLKPNSVFVSVLSNTFVRAFIGQGQLYGISKKDGQFPKNNSFYSTVHFNFNILYSAN